MEEKNSATAVGRGAHDSEANERETDTRKMDWRLMTELCCWQWMQQGIIRKMFSPREVELARTQGWRESAEPSGQFIEGGGTQRPSKDPTACFKYVIPALYDHTGAFDLHQWHTTRWGAVVGGFHTGGGKTACEAICIAAIAYLDASRKEANVTVRATASHEVHSENETKDSPPC